MFVVVMDSQGGVRHGLVVIESLPLDHPSRVRISAWPQCGLRGGRSHCIILHKKGDVVAHWYRSSLIIYKGPGFESGISHAGENSEDRQSHCAYGKISGQKRKTSP